MWATKVHRRLGTMSLRMTCAISFYYGNSHTHCGKRLGTIIPWTRRNEAFIQRRFYTQNLLHVNTFTHRRFHTETFFHAKNAKTLLHTDAFTHKHFCTHTLLHTDAFTCKHFYIQTLLHTDAFTLRHFYTQTLFHTDPFTHRRFYTQTLLHTDASTETFTQRRSQSAAPLGDLSCKQRCANIVAMEMPKNRKSAQDQAQYHDQRTIQCKASALWDTK